MRYVATNHVVGGYESCGTWLPIMWYVATNHVVVANRKERGSLRSESHSDMSTVRCSSKMKTR